jgi:hypothetical protein
LLIFDSFPDRKSAEKFAAAVVAEYDHGAEVFDSWHDSQRSDPFPFQLDGFIVHVERREDYADESQIIALVRSHGGSYAGT